MHQSKLASWRFSYRRYTIINRYTIFHLTVQCVVHVTIKPATVSLLPSIFEPTLHNFHLTMGFFSKIAVCCVLLLCSNLALALDEELVITNADRAIDVSSQLVKIAHRLTLSNTGKSSVNSFTFLVAASSKNDLSFFEAQVQH